MGIDVFALIGLVGNLSFPLAKMIAKYAQSPQISVKLMKWHGMLEKINSVTTDVEEKQMSGDSAVCKWLEDLQDVTLDTEDLLDDALSDRQMAKEVDKMDCRLDEIFKQLNLLQLRENSESGSSSFYRRISRNIPVPTSLPERVFYGRENEMEELTLRLIGIDAVDKEAANFTVIPIVGMAGVGKTALVQRLYKHEVVKEEFVLTAWAHVSDTFDCIAITKSILETVAPSISCEGKCNDP